MGIATGLVSPFLIEVHTNVYANSIASDPTIAVLNQTTVSLGQTPVKMTYYTLKSLSMTYCGITVTRMTEGVGRRM